MVNDDKYGNCKMKKVTLKGAEYLCLFATADLSPGEQLLYDYGDDPSKLFWRQKVC